MTGGTDPGVLGYGTEETVQTGTVEHKKVMKEYLLGRRLLSNLFYIEQETSEEFVLYIIEKYKKAIKEKKILRRN